MFPECSIYKNPYNIKMLSNEFIPPQNIGVGWGFALDPTGELTVLPRP